MRRTVLFIQGAGEGTYADWDSELVASLERELGPRFAIRYPPMPNEDDAPYHEWKPVIVKELADLRSGDILVGHSAGGTCLTHTLAEHPPNFIPGALILIAAPFMGKGGWQADDMTTPDDLGSVLPAGMPVSVWHGDADETVPPDHSGLYAKAISHARFHVLPGRDHQLNNDLRDIAKDILRIVSPS